MLCSLKEIIMGRRKKKKDREKKKPETRSPANKDQSATKVQSLEEKLEPDEIGWKFHLIPLIISIIIAVIFYILIFIFVK